ncbi:MAG: histidine--tRNA ligase [Myxococcota bacterium]|nr:histidine--tRNA ligase [Deltaproteobacteria bacterium]MCP4244921.1 histidine--tRNA ligase [bacterium]MDP6076489.1 histidine--tRNA ligase [Myxococcota bacterium]MDP6243249.1 histidine--tRNA ligase [Myxococcota bacterium]MDP7073933.1 histidine--tRNA ligase [Myxococcota bacterium]
MSQKLQPPRGTRDFYPEDMRLRTWLFDHFRTVANAYGFEEVDAPVVEHEDLFTRKAGEEIVDQLYHFELHGRRLALRPEMTPSIARMVMGRAGSLRLPLRWFTVTQNWRYERMTRGRRREHYQWNMDVWGEPRVTAEAELIAALFSLLDRLGLAGGEVKVRVSSRSLLEASLRSSVLADRPETFPALCVAIDKLDKIGRDAVIDLLTDTGGQVRLPRPDAIRVVDWLSLADIDAAGEGLPADTGPRAELRELFDWLDAYGLADRVEFDASIVRGLAYYTGIVFEAFDAARSLRAICGGGRYDRLLETLGGPAVPAVGFGFGDIVILDLLEDLERVPELRRNLDAVVFAFGDAERSQAIRLAAALRSEGQAVELALANAKLKRALADADRAGARRVYLLGPDEVARGIAVVRDLETGDQSEHRLST